MKKDSKHSEPCASYRSRKTLARAADSRPLTRVPKFTAATVEIRYCLTPIIAASAESQSSKEVLVALRLPVPTSPVTQFLGQPKSSCPTLVARSPAREGGAVHPLRSFPTSTHLVALPPENRETENEERKTENRELRTAPSPSHCQETHLTTSPLSIH